MASSLFKRGLWAIGVIAALAALVFVALPLVARTQIVRDRIALELSSWSGYQVRIGAAPEIEVWPSFRAILTDVTLSPWNAPDRPPVIAAPRVAIKLSAWAALRGGVEFSSLHVFGPTLLVEPAGNGLYLPALPGGGRLTRAIAAARDIVAADPDAPDTDALPGDPFGIVTISEGHIVTMVDGAPVEMAGKINGELDWGALNRAGTLSLEGTWREESLTLDMSSSSPLLLMAGADSPVKLSLASTPVNASFDGIVKVGANPYWQGQAKFAAPSLRQTLEWLQASAASNSTAGAVSISSRITGDAGRVKFENAEVGLDGNPSIGALELLFTETVPALSGTLAFNTLDLGAFLAAFTPLTTTTGEAGDIDRSFVNHFDLDLRLSAARATAGNVNLANVAANAQVKGGFAAFDISDATVFGGTLQTGIRFDSKPEGTQVELRLLASDIEGGAFGAATGMQRLVPIGQGTVSVILKGPGRGLESMLDKADGSISANFGAGALTGFDMDAFLKRAAQGGFFPLAEISGGSLPIEAAALKATMTQGVIKVDRAEVKAGQRKIVLSGIMPYVGRGLALSGVVQPAADQTPPVRNEAAFFVGGSWNAPFISPVYPNLEIE